MTKKESEINVDHSEPKDDLLSRLGRLSDEDWSEIEKRAARGVYRAQLEIVLPAMTISFVVVALLVYIFRS